jgi:hypothetical protein
MKTYTKDNYNIKTIAGLGEGKITFAVDGYSEKETVVIEVKRVRDYYDNAKTKWKVSMEHARWLSLDEKSKISPLDAAQALIAEMTEALAVAREIEADKESFEPIFQKAEAERNQIEEAKRAEAKALADADKPVGMKLAKQIVEHMRGLARNTEKGRFYASQHGDHQMTITLAERGTRQTKEITIHHSWAGLLLFSHGTYGSRISKNDAMALIANSAIDGLKVDKVNFADPKLVKFMMKM